MIIFCSRKPLALLNSNTGTLCDVEAKLARGRRHPVSNSQYKTSKQPDRRKPQPKNLGPRLRKKFNIKYKSFEEPSSIKTNFPNARKVEENNKNHDATFGEKSKKAQKFCFQKLGKRLGLF